MSSHIPFLRALPFRQGNPLLGLKAYLEHPDNLQVLRSSRGPRTPSIDLSIYQEICGPSYILSISYKAPRVPLVYSLECYLPRSDLICTKILFFHKTCSISLFRNSSCFPLLYFKSKETPSLHYLLF